MFVIYAYLFSLFDNLTEKNLQDKKIVGEDHNPSLDSDVKPQVPPSPD